MAFGFGSFKRLHVLSMYRLGRAARTDQRSGGDRVGQPGPSATRFGRGAYDMKASLAAIMIAARSARSLHLKGDVIVTAVADEEVASFGTSAVLSQFRADYAIVTEPTELRLCLAHKGFVWLEVETTG